MNAKSAYVGLFACLSFVLAACGAAAPSPTSAPTAALPTSAPSVFANPSVPFEGVVQIAAAFYDENGELQIGWTGSGTIISADGLILTNAHVVLPDRNFPVDAIIVYLTTSQDQPPTPSFYAEVLQADAALDIAVIRVTTDYDGNPVDNASLNLPHVVLGDSDKLNLGDDITILGYPGIGGETVTLTSGKVSGFTSQPDYGQRAFIKTSATIAGGNSGGLAADSAGEIVGIPTQLGYGGEDQYVDCRQLADTNRDGVVDENDDCVPTGGFINALRPVSLALPLIQAAQRGEVSIVGAEETQQAAAPQSGTYTDDFSDPNSGWDVYSYETASAYYFDGQYYMEDVNGDLYYYAFPYLTFDNVTMSVDASAQQDDGGNEIDLVCRFTDLDNYYEFRIFTDGYVGIARKLAGEYINLVEPRATGAVIGLDPVKLSITCNGNQLQVSVDGHVAAQTTDNSFVTGDVGLAVYDATGTDRFTAAFDNFKATSLASQPAGQIVIHDDFSDPNSGWGEYSDSENYNMHYVDGRYFIELTPEDDRIHNWLEQEFEDVVMNVDVSIEHPATDGSVGIMCRFVDLDNYYGLQVSEDGYYSIYKRVDGEDTYILDWTASSLIPTDGSPFVLNAACQGAQLSVGINGQLLGQITDADLSSGYTGLVADTWINGGLVVSFDNYEVIQY